MLRRIIFSLAATAIWSAASAQTVGIVKREPNNTFQETIWKRVGQIGAASGIAIRTVSADSDSKRQLEQTEAFYASGADAVIVALTSPKIAGGLAAIARKAHKPLIFVSTKPPLEALGEGVTYVGTEAGESGTMEMAEVCRRMKGRGTVAILMGDLSSSSAKARMTTMHETLKTPVCGDVEVLEEQSAGWSRALAREVVRNWLSAGLKPDAIVSSNDEMAVGAIETLRSAGITGTIVAGTDAIDDALPLLQSGALTFTILQDGKQMGDVAMATVRKMTAGEAVPPTIILPYTLLTPDRAAATMRERAGG